MKKKIIITCSVIIGILILSLIGYFSYKVYQNWRIENAVIIVQLEDTLEVEVFSEVKLSDLVKSINGEFIDDFVINTKSVGTKTIDFKFVNDEDIEVSYSFDIAVVDKTAPLIFGSKSFSVTVGYTGNLEEELFCGDNYDDNPECKLLGVYDYNTPGTYSVSFVGTDSSGNVATNNFNLIVKEKSGGSDSNLTTSTGIYFSDLVSKYKNDNTSIGLDVSRWQGDIDFQKVKDAGVEFVFIRVGSQKGIGGEYYIDPKFEQNIKGFQNVGIPVGIYFYSYADSIKAAKEEANWIVKQLDGYNIELPVAFDWENWSFYQEFNKSFYNLTEIAKAYLGVIEKAGYDGMLYSSKNYLENVWFETKYPVWLAHYTEQTNYAGEYKVWQLCNNGLVDGINGYVDINVMYS